MNLGDVVGRRDIAGADRPDRLIGDHQFPFFPFVGKRAGELASDDSEMLAASALRVALADADDRRQSAGKGRFGLRPDQLVCLMLVGPSLGMADDRHSRAGLLDHRHRDASGMGTARRRVDVLGADDEAARSGHGRCDQREWRTDGDVHSRRFAGGSPDRGKFAQLGDAAIHLPVAGDELATDVHDLTIPPV